MNKEKDKSIPFPLNSLHICVDSYEADIQGRVYSPMSEAPIEFNNCGELFIKTNDLFDQKGYPQAYQERRRFRKGHGSNGYRMPERNIHNIYIEEIEKVRRSAHPFEVIVTSRKRSSWQGIIRFSQETSENVFESDMELLNYICQELKKERKE